MRGISGIEEKPLTTVYSLIKRVEIKAYVGISVLQGQLKNLTAKFIVLDESWTYVRVRHGPKGIFGFGLLWLMVRPLFNTDKGL